MSQTRWRRAGSTFARRGEPDDHYMGVRTAATTRGEDQHIDGARAGAQQRPGAGIYRGAGGQHVADKDKPPGVHGGHAAWMDGEYKTPPSRGLRALGRVWAGWRTACGRSSTAAWKVPAGCHISESLSVTRLHRHDA
jgi:hypothetical protein